MSSFFDDFLIDCEVRGLSNATVKGYREKLSTYFKNYEWSQESVNQFILDSRKKGMRTATINCYLRTLKVLNNYKQDCIIIHFLKQEEIVKDIYTSEELKILLKKPNTKNFNEFKTWALISFLVGTGCRLSTALEIKISDLDLQSGYVIFRHSKNHRQQVFPLSKGLLGVLKQYLQVRGGDGYLFPNQYGNKADKRTTQKQVADYNKARGVNKTSCHLFRHCFAANYIMNGGDAFRLQQLLGHSTLDMTRHYVQIYGKNLGDRIEELSPLDNNIKQKIMMG